MSTGHTVYPANIPWRTLSVGLPAYAPSYNQHSSRAISEGWVLPPPQNNMAAKYIRMHLRCSSPLRLHSSQKYFSRQQHRNIAAGHHSRNCSQIPTLSGRISSERYEIRKALPGNIVDNGLSLPLLNILTPQRRH